MLLMAKTVKLKVNWLQINVLRAARVHYYYIAALTASVMVYDAWKVITPQAVLQRWTLLAIMLILVTGVWYASRANARNQMYYRLLAYVLIATDIFVAAFLVYLERGMASRSVALFAVPIAVSMVLNSRSALFATATMCVAAYSFAAVKYFVDFFNEGYRIELYTVLTFYSVCFFVLAGLLWVVMRSHNPNE